MHEITDGLDIMKITDLRDLYMDLLAHFIIDALNYSTEKLIGRLKKYFGNRLSFWQKQKRTETEIVFSENVSIGHEVEVAVLSTVMSDFQPAPVSGLDEHNKANKMFRCAHIIRAELMDVWN